MPTPFGTSEGVPLIFGGGSKLVRIRQRQRQTHGDRVVELSRKCERTAGRDGRVSERPLALPARAQRDQDAPAMCWHCWNVSTSRPLALKQAVQRSPRRDGQTPGMLERRRQWRQWHRNLAPGA